MPQYITPFAQSVKASLLVRFFGWCSFLARESADMEVSAGEVRPAAAAGSLGNGSFIDGGQVPFFDHDPALDDGIVHWAPETHRSQHIGGTVFTAHQLQPAAVHKEQVGAFANGQLADIIPAQQPALPRVAIFNTW